MPSEIKEAVDEMLRIGTFSYEQIKDYLAQQGVSVSQSSICRYAQRLAQNYQELQIAQEHYRALLQEARKYPDLDTTEVLTRLASHRMLHALMAKGEKEWDGLQVEKLLKEISGLTRAVAYKQRVETQNKEEAALALDEIRATVFSALAQEQPQLYRDLERWLESRKEAAR